MFIMSKITAPNCILYKFEYAADGRNTGLPVPATLVLRDPDGEDITIDGLNVTPKELNEIHEIWNARRRVTVTLTIS
jgi:hypothetical protein